MSVITYGKYKAPPDKAFCAHCGIEFKPRRAVQRFCCKAHRLEYWKARYKTVRIA